MDEVRQAVCGQLVHSGTDPIVHFDEQSLLLRKCSGEAFLLHRSQGNQGTALICQSRQTKEIT